MENFTVALPKDTKDWTKDQVLAILDLYILALDNGYTMTIERECSQ